MEIKKLIKLLVLFLFSLALVRLFFGRSDIKESLSLTKKIRIMNVDKFWSKNYNPKVGKMPLVHHTITTPVHDNARKMPAKEEKTPANDSHVPPALRVVHLDLKGAAPKVSYLQQLFPLLSSLGANGILIEYEDMFPYVGDLQLLRSKYAYSVEDIEAIKTQAELNNLELIPLVQVFGHLEFVLKHEKYFHLRENLNFPNSLNPQAPGSLDLVKQLLMQVLEKHPKAQWFHIGADEVYGLGESKESQNWIKQNRSLESLFLSHVTKVCQFMVEQRPGLKLLFWEDMFRRINSDTIKESGITSVAYPMIWQYDSNLDVPHTETLLLNLQEAGFTGVWFASAFKGASTSFQMWTPINLHLQNHIAWIKIMASVKKLSSMKLQGIVLTGWQRYNHYTVLCELLPVGIPSLATCLQTLKYGTFNEEAQNVVQKLLGCKVQVDTNKCYGTETFPGGNIYRMVERIYDNLPEDVGKLMKNYYLRGSFSPYQRKYNFANPRDLAPITNALTSILSTWEPFLKTFLESMDAIFYPDTVEEWLDENVNPHMNKIHDLLVQVDQISKLKGRPKNLNSSNENKVVPPRG